MGLLKKKCSGSQVLLLSAVLLLLTSAASAQNCALCYTQAASASRRMIQGLRSGILVLVVPPMFLSFGIAVLAYRKRNQFSQPSERPRDEW